MKVKPAQNSLARNAAAKIVVAVYNDAQSDFNLLKRRREDCNESYNENLSGMQT